MLRKGENDPAWILEVISNGARTVSVVSPMGAPARIKKQRCVCLTLMEQDPEAAARCPGEGSETALPGKMPKGKYCRSRRQPWRSMDSAAEGGHSAAEEATVSAVPAGPTEEDAVIE